MDRETGGPAFPVTVDDIRDFTSYKDNDLTGMTLRDAFAIATLIGAVSKGAFDNVEDYAALSYKMADAMLAERQK